MIVHLLFNGIPIGAGSLMQLDPPMGIATGTFEPTDHYDRDSHANIVEGKYLSDRGKSLVAISNEYGPIDCSGVGIEDSFESIGEQVVTIFGIPYPKYSEIFADYEDYKSYYPDRSE
ncbi:hypothetical protein [Azorhizobium sp. AG788]|uniref:hypothetical protein n=1 Tax=Azorhizobium sp. AG788 TaxID=2183897 RepID=UPI003139B181